MQVPGCACRAAPARPAPRPWASGNQPEAPYGKRQPVRRESVRPSLPGAIQPQVQIHQAEAGRTPGARPSPLRRYFYVWAGSCLHQGKTHGRSRNRSRTPARGAAPRQGNSRFVRRRGLHRGRYKLFLSAFRPSTSSECAGVDSSGPSAAARCALCPGWPNGSSRRDPVRSWRSPPASWPCSSRFSLT